MLVKEVNRQPDGLWDKFCASRIGYLLELAKTVEEGVRRTDTRHPVFCGCIDWHSSVHGIYSLLTASRLTKESGWDHVVEKTLVPQRLSEELACLQRGQLDHELPYGYAWFLKLAQERERRAGQTDLLPLAKEIARRLSRWVFSLSADEIVHHAHRREYGNVSWAVLNLWEWCRFKGERDQCEQLRAFTKEQLLRLDEKVPHSHDAHTDEFFAASLQRARVILTILPPEDSLPWLGAFYRDGPVFQPVMEMPRPHSAGLNFSRAWGLWALFQATRDEAYRYMYVNHIVTHMESPQYWRDDYKKYSHWVPQFGIYAIALSMEDVGQDYDVAGQDSRP